MLQDGRHVFDVADELPDLRREVRVPGSQLVGGERPDGVAGFIVLVGNCVDAGVVPGRTVSHGYSDSSISTRRRLSPRLRRPATASVERPIWSAISASERSCRCFWMMAVRWSSGSSDSASTSFI